MTLFVGHPVGMSGQKLKPWVAVCTMDVRAKFAGITVINPLGKAERECRRCSCIVRLRTALR